MLECVSPCNGVFIGRQDPRPPLNPIRSLLWNGLMLVEEGQQWLIISLKDKMVPLQIGSEPFHAHHTGKGFLFHLRVLLLSLTESTGNETHWFLHTIGHAMR